MTDINQNQNYDKSLENSTIYNLDNFVKAIEYLFSGNNNLSSISNSYINRFSKSSEALDIVIQALNLENSSEKVYYNAIVILKKKLKFNFGNYCSDHNKLKAIEKILLLNIQKFKKCDKLYIVQALCDCLSLLILFSFQSLPNMFQETVNYFLTEDNNISNDSNIKYLVNLQNKYCLVSFLMQMGEIPEESNIVVDKEQMNAFVSFIISISDDVLDLLNKSIIENNLLDNKEDLPSEIKLLNNELSRSILITFLNWLDLNIPSTTIEKLSSNYYTLLNFIFSINQYNLKYHKQAICLLICDKSSFYLNNLIIEKVISMKPLVGKAIETKNTEGIVFFLDVYEALCTENLSSILTSHNKDLLKVFLELTKVVDEDRIMYVCDFWTQVIKSILEDESIRSDKEYLEIVNNAIVALTGKVKWEEEIFIRLNKERYSALKEDEDFIKQENFRICIKELLGSISRAINFNDLYKRYFQKEIINIINLLKANLGNMKYWAIFEALIYCVSCISSSATIEDSSLLEEVLMTVIEVPIELTQINRTATDLIDDVSKLLHLLPEILKSIFLYLVKGLDNPLTKSKLLKIYLIYY